MKQARSAPAIGGVKTGTGKTVINPQAEVSAVHTKPDGRNDELKFVAVGVSDRKGKFLLVATGEKYVVLSVRSLGRNVSAELERLEALDVHFLAPGSRNRFLSQAENAAKMEPTFKVATQIGWFDDIFVLPDRVFPPQPQIVGMPKGLSKFLVYLDAKDDDVHSRFRCSGSSEKSQEIYRLCRGSTRLIFAAALSFVGPCCAPFGLRPPGVQAVGDHGSGKTVFGIIVGMALGGIPDSTLGFGSAWNGTPNGLEDYGPALKDTACILDETSLMPTDPRGRTLAFGEALMRLRQGQGKKRYGLSIDRWASLLVSTSNLSVYALLDAKRRENYGAYTDRLMDIPAPNHSNSFFENLHGFKNPAKFGKYVFDIATHNCGHPIRSFLDSLTAELARDREGLQALVDRNVAKYDAAAENIRSSLRPTLRVGGYFATVYAAGCLAIRYKILPFTEPELLAAIILCHRDHVAFVDNEVTGGPAWTGAASITAPGAQSAVGAIAQSSTVFVRVKRFMEDSNRRRRFHDATARGRQLPGADFDGYVLRRDGKRWEYWIPPERFKGVVGDDAQDREAKYELLRRGLIVTERRGDRRNFTVKRKTPDGKRSYFVVLRQTARR